MLVEQADSSANPSIATSSTAPVSVNCVVQTEFSSFQCKDQSTSPIPADNKAVVMDQSPTMEIEDNKVAKGMETMEKDEIEEAMEALEDLEETIEGPQ